MSPMVQNSPSFVKDFLEGIQTNTPSSINVMEVCGTHTTVIARSGLRSVIPKTVHLLSGPGCPVCVTANGEIDRLILLAQCERVTLFTFGDMLHVPGTKGSLESVRTQKGNVRIVYSPADALNYAKSHPSINVVFVGVGFETTIPSIAATVMFAHENRIKNFFVAPLFKLVPPALRAILEIKERKVDGFILPGHVSTVIGSNPYQFLAEEFHVPGVISGFEPSDILESLSMLSKLIREKRAEIQNQYCRSVTPEGNLVALKLIDILFEVEDVQWRAIGKIPRSGLKFKGPFLKFDAFLHFSIPEIESKEPQGCRCGKILLGLCGPLDCPLFRQVCTPSDPVGPCMVSSEGACSALYHYGGDS